VRHLSQKITRTTVTNLRFGDVDLHGLVQMAIDGVHVLHPWGDFATDNLPIADESEFKAAAVWQHADEFAL
jgi:hypothetical protein